MNEKKKKKKKRENQMYMNHWEINKKERMLEQKKKLRFSYYQHV